ncbi:LamG domain-containing protein [Microbacterium sp. 22195]|uniref:LamG domain-containing protein n=1 Tax=Microbacterium sp. 22195 TaxID=3453891 RepID=UPI003F843A6C
MISRFVRASVALSCAAAVVWAGAVPAAASSAVPASGGLVSTVVQSAAAAQAKADAAVSAAQQQAAESGAPVVVEELTSPTELTTAMPDGSTQLEQWTVPVRVPREGGWVPVDTTLQREGDWYSPAASVSGVRFSAGGSGALSQTQTASGEWISETWTHGDLPAPTIEGDTATYAEVLPGVDLKLTATASGMASVYVVKSEQAARSSELSELGVAVEGATLSTPERGLVKARAADGSSLLANQPLWWDSSGGGTFDAPGAGMPPTPVEHAVTADEVTLDVGASVDAQLKREGSVTYPIFVDPDWAPGMTASWDTDRAYPNARHLTTDPLYVGNYSTWHSDMFFRFPIGSVAGKQILNAVLGTTLTNVAACPPGPISSHYINYTSIPNPGFTWNEESAMKASGQMAWSGPMQSWTGPSTCGAKWESVGWTVTTAITTQLAASKPSVDIAFTGNNSTSRKHFAKAASLTISYNTPPSTPTGAKFSSPDRPCGTAAAPAMIGQTDVTVVVDQRDPDGGNVDVNFDLVEAANLGVVVQHTTGGLAAQGLKYGTFTGLTNGKTYAWRARGSDWLIDGVGYSPWCYFTVDTTPPAFPAVSVPSSGLTVGGTSSATITVNPSDGVDFVAYTVNAAPISEAFVFDRFASRPTCGAVLGLVHIACPSATGTVSVPFSPADSASTIWAVSYDKAGNPSVVPGQPSSEAGRRGVGVQVTASNSGAVSFAAGHVWRTQSQPSPLGASIPDSHASSPVPLTLGRDTIRTLKANPVSPGSSLLKSVLGFADPATTGLTGPDFSASSSAVSAFAGSYSVAAWLKPGASGTGTAVSMGAGSASRIAVTAGNWEFCAATSTGSSCVSAARPTGDQWVHVAGVADVVNGQLRLYLDGALAATAPRPDTAQNLGSSVVDVGVARSAGAVAARWPGQLADVAVFGGVPTSSQLAALRLGTDPAQG